MMEEKENFMKAEVALRELRRLVVEASERFSSEQVIATVLSLIAPKTPYRVCVLRKKAPPPESPPCAATPRVQK